MLKIYAAGQNDACMVAITIIHTAQFVSVSFSQGDSFCPDMASYLLYKQKLV